MSRNMNPIDLYNVLVESSSLKTFMEGREEIEKELDTLSALSGEEIKDIWKDKVSPKEDTSTPNEDDMVEDIMAALFGAEYKAYLKKEVGLKEAEEKEQEPEVGDTNIPTDTEPAELIEEPDIEPEASAMEDGEKEQDKKNPHGMEEITDKQLEQLLDKKVIEDVSVTNEDTSTMDARIRKLFSEDKTEVLQKKIDRLNSQAKEIERQQRFSRKAGRGDSLQAIYTEIDRTERELAVLKKSLGEGKVNETVQELVGETPGIDKLHQKILNWAIDSKKIPNQFPDSDTMKTRLADHPKVQKLDKDMAISLSKMNDEADLRSIYLRYILLPIAQKAFNGTYSDTEAWFPVKESLHLCNKCSKTFRSNVQECTYCKSKDVERIVESEYDRQLAMGMEIEKEHTDDPEEAKKIANDHLKEDPKYYTKLKKMEAGDCDEAKLKEENEKESFTSWFESNYKELKHDYMLYREHMKGRDSFKLWAEKEYAKLDESKLKEAYEPGDRFDMGSKRYEVLFIKNSGKTVVARDITTDDVEEMDLETAVEESKLVEDNYFSKDSLTKLYEAVDQDLEYIAVGESEFGAPAIFFKYKTRSNYLIRVEDEEEARTRGQLVAKALGVRFVDIEPAEFKAKKFGRTVEASESDDTVDSRDVRNASLVIKEFKENKIKFSVQLRRDGSWNCFANSLRISGPFNSKDSANESMKQICKAVKLNESRFETLSELKNIIKCWNNETKLNEEELLSAPIKKLNTAGSSYYVDCPKCKKTKWLGGGVSDSGGITFCSGCNTKFKVDDVEVKEGKLLEFDDNKDGYNVKAKGIVDKADADALALKYKGTVIQDPEDPKKFSVITKVEEAHFKTNHSTGEWTEISFDELDKYVGDVAGNSVKVSGGDFNGVGRIISKGADTIALKLYDLKGIQRLNHASEYTYYVWTTLAADGHAMEYDDVDESKLNEDTRSEVIDLFYSKGFAHSGDEKDSVGNKVLVFVKNGEEIKVTLPEED